MQDLQIQPANRTHISHRDLPINQKSITMLQDSNLHPMQRSNQLSIRRNGVRIYMKSMVLTIFQELYEQGSIDANDPYLIEAFQ